MIEGRIRAVSNAHALLSESRWEGADLKRLAEEELAPYRDGEAERVSLSGPVVLLKTENGAKHRTGACTNLLPTRPSTERSHCFPEE